MEGFPTTRLVGFSVPEVNVVNRTCFRVYVLGLQYIEDIQTKTFYSTSRLGTVRLVWSRIGLFAYHG